MAKLRILITGGTGFLGKWVIPELKALGGEGTVVDCISRTQDGCLKGDLTQWDAGMNLPALRGRYDVLIHLAGLYDLRADLAEGLKHNVMATHNALVIAQKAEIPHFVHASTVAVTVGEHGSASDQDLKRVGMNSADPIIFPDILDTSRAFPDSYARTKAYAEHLVKQWPTGNLRSKLNLRLGILVGDSKAGKIQRIDGPYHAAEFLRRNKKLITLYHGKLPLPGSPDRTFPIVPVDVAARAIARLVSLTYEEKWEGYKSLHLFPRRGIGAHEFYRSALRHLGYSNTEFSLVGGLPKPILKRLGEWISDIPKEEIEYLLSFPRLDVTETESILGPKWCPDFIDYEAEFWKGYHEYLSHR